MGANDRVDDRIMVCERTAPGDSMTLLVIFFIVTIGYMLCGSFALVE
jgi:hypothetical protein